MFCIFEFLHWVWSRHNSVYERRNSMSKKMMKALVKKYPKRGLWMDEVPVPDIGINDVLIKIIKTSICGTDLHIYNWD